MEIATWRLPAFHYTFCCLPPLSHPSSAPVLPRLLMERSSAPEHHYLLHGGSTSSSWHLLWMGTIKLRFLCFLGMSFVWTFTAQQSHSLGCSREATGWSILEPWPWSSETSQCEIVNKSGSLAIQNLSEELLKSSRVFIINLQLVRISWTQEHGPSPYSPSSDSWQHCFNCMFCFYWGKN